MAVTFTHDSRLPGENQSAGSMLALAGTFTFSGSYATGGDTFPTGKNLEDLFKRIGRGIVLDLTTVRGYTAEWNPTTKKLQLFSNGAEVSAGAYAAALTASPCPVVLFGR